MLALALLACAATPLDRADDTAAETWDRGPNPHPLDDVLRLDHVQALGTHNSTHVEPESPLDDSHRYTHAPLSVQLGEYGVRQVELDLHLHETEGWQVFHLPVIDAETTCLALADCLGELKGWSDDHGWHLPLLVWLEPKDDLDGTQEDLLPLTGRLWDLEQALLEVWPEDRVFRPDELRGDHPDLPTAIAQDGWPLLGELRGQVLFALLDSDAYRDEYLADSPALEGRVMFADAGTATDPWSALVKDGSAEEITAWAQAGFVVTDNVDGADASDEENQAGLDQGLAAGTHFLASDLPGPVEGREYRAAIPGGQPARCNPVTAPPECTPQAIEDLDG
ncbi:Ca2+-dependent phosphoinositide-specific phospholipase C [Myxococcota bacterium]|nr:Ca2+-dependent phosphoinositide-specific phospholipase C [Myxococcota bacterium]